MLGEKYEKMGSVEDAIRCIHQSLELNPRFEAASQLAALYLEQRDRQSWETMWEAFLQLPDNSSNHYFAQLEIADAYCGWGEWQNAKPYILEAAQVWGTISLYQASFVLEGLGEWKQSEYWMTEATTNYPSHYGYAWYYWCRRTGRGNLAAALEHAKAYFANPLGKPTRASQVLQGSFAVLQDDRDTARAAYAKALDFYPSYTCTLMVSKLAREALDTETHQRAIAALRKHYQESPPDDESPELTKAGMAVVDLTEAQQVSDEQIEQIGTLIQQVPDSPTRSALAYFFGCELDRLGKETAALEYWRHALVLPSRDHIYATLAGHELCLKKTTSRQDDDVLGKDDLWGPATAE